MRLIDADALSAKMYHDAFETDSGMQKWDSGCWIRYKMFEKNLEDAPTIEQPERKKGKWLDGKGNVKVIGYGAYCSCCKRESEYLDNYCGWCGALMNEEEWKEWSE